MKKPVLTILAAASFLIVSGSVRVLTRVSAPDIDMSQGAVNVLFSRLDGTGADRLKVTSHGDSLTVESDGHRRVWFAWRSDTAHYAGEETLTVIEGPSMPVPAFGFPLTPGDHRENTFSQHCVENKTRRSTRIGVYSSETGSTGKLVLPEGDTIKGIIPVKDILSLEADTISKKVRETVRWFRNGDRLPIAIVTEEKTFYNDGRSDEIAACYAVESHTLAEEDLCRSGAKDETDEYRYALERTLVSTASGYIEINAVFPDIDSGITLSIGITDIAGHLFAHEERQATGVLTVIIPTTGLRAGEYIVGLTLSRPVITEKRYISVRP